jgi:hypothetical protein
MRAEKITRSDVFSRARLGLLALLAAPAAAKAAPEGGMSTLERLEAIEEIKRLKARRDHAIDLKDWATYEATHTPDVRSHPQGQKAWTSAAEMTADVRASLDGAATAHHSHTPDITFESPVRAKGVWVMEDNLHWKQGEEAHWFRGFGFYYETYEKRDGRWLIAERRMTRVHTEASPGAVLNGRRF